MPEALWWSNLRKRPDDSFNTYNECIFFPLIFWSFIPRFLFHTKNHIPVQEFLLLWEFASQAQAPLPKISNVNKNLHTSTRKSPSTCCLKITKNEKLSDLFGLELSHLIDHKFLIILLLKTLEKIGYISRQQQFELNSKIIFL